MTEETLEDFGKRIISWMLERYIVGGTPVCALVSTDRLIFEIEGRTRISQKLRRKWKGYYEPRFKQLYGKILEINGEKWKFILSPPMDRKFFIVHLDDGERSQNGIVSAWLQKGTENLKRDEEQKVR